MRLGWRLSISTPVVHRFRSSLRHDIQLPLKPVLVTRTEPPRETAPLTKREREVLARIAEGMTSKEIAADLGVSLRTVGTHREHLAKKLSTSSVAAFVRYAIHNGIVLGD